MDAVCNSATRANTIHIEGMPDGPASHKWALMTRATATGNDGDGNGRIIANCGMRGGPYSIALGGAPSSLTQGHIPLIRVPCFYRDTAATPDRKYFLGYFPNIRVINMSAFQPDTEFAQGGDTWSIFPMVRRQETGGSTDERTGFGGIAYKKT